MVEGRRPYHAAPYVNVNGFHLINGIKLNQCISGTFVGRRTTHTAHVRAPRALNTHRLTMVHVID